VSGEFYFIAVGGLGVTLAGFAGLIAALEGRAGETRAPIAAWRIRHVVFQGFGVTFVAFAIVAFFALTDDVAVTVRLGTIAGVLSIAANWRSLMPGAAWPDERRRWGAIVARSIVGVVGLTNLAVASVGFLELYLLVILSGPASTFILAVADVTHGAESRADPADGAKD
jgi:hypothetical protein